MPPPDHITLAILDEELALRDLATNDQDQSRTEFLQRAVVTGGALVAGGVLVTGLPSLAVSAPSRAQDARILRLALRLEYLQAAFYRAASKATGLGSELLGFAKVAAGHEQAHVDLIRGALGAGAPGPPSFDFGAAATDRRRFAAAAVMLEDLGVAAYNGQATNLTRDALRAASRIVSVDARHAAWVRSIVGQLPAPKPTDPGISASRVDKAITATGFVRGG